MSAPTSHLLETEWTIWSYPRVTGSKITALAHQRLTEDDLKDLSPASAAANLYARDLQVKARVSTVEEFFTVWQTQQKPSNMPAETNTAIFRGQLKPMWEAFPNGGRFVLRLRRPQAEPVSKVGASRASSPKVPNERSYHGNTIGARDPALAAFVDQLWENIVLRLIGESFALPELVGAVCSMRTREVVLSIWVCNAEHIVLRRRIRDQLKKVILESQEAVAPHYDVHYQPLNGHPVLMQFNTFSNRLREQQRDIIAKVTRSTKRHYGGRYGASTTDSGSAISESKACSPCAPEAAPAEYHSMVTADC